MKKIILIALTMSLAACASTDIVKLSPDTYMLTQEDHGGIFAFNRGAMKSDAIRVMTQMSM